MELILVDDGSTDGSGSLCDEYASDDGRIRVVHRKNAGASSARRTGLRESRNEYVLFVDADDWVEPDAVIRLMELSEASEADVITASWILHDGGTVITDDGNMPEGVYRAGVNKCFFASNMIYFGRTDRNGINGSLNTKVIRRNLLNRIYAEFPEGVAYAEDDFVVYACMANADIAEVTHIPLYHYEMIYSSVSHSRIPTFLSDLEKGYHFFIDAVKDNPDYGMYKRQIEIYVQRALFTGIEKYLGFNERSAVSWYRLDIKDISDGARIVLYGAGKVGKSYYRQLSNDRSVKLAAWVDREYMVYQKDGYPVKPVEDIFKYNPDYIIIAVDDETKASDISDRLAKEFINAKGKILWKKPINILDDLLNEGALW